MNLELLEIDKLKALLTSYLENHPQSEDTLRGISTYWIQIQLSRDSDTTTINDSEVAVKQALEKLIGQGVVQGVERNGTEYYRLIHNQ